MQNQEYAAEPILSYQTSVMVRRGHTHETCQTIHDLLETDWALNYAADGRDAIIQYLFGPFDAHIDDRRIIQAHSAMALQSMLEFADMATWGPTALSVLRPYRDQVAIVPLREDFERSQLSIKTRHNAPHSTCVMCFIDCLKSVIRRHSRSTAQHSKDSFSTIRIDN